MIGRSRGAQQYRIILRGECGRLITSLIDHVQVEQSRNGNTSVVIAVRDDPEFWGLMALLQDLALHVVSLQELGYGGNQADIPSDGREPAGGSY